MAKTPTEAASLATLPLILQAECLLRLSADERLALALVCKPWKLVVAEPTLWQVVDLSQTSGVRRVSPALLLGISAKARGTMRSFDVSRASFLSQYVKIMPKFPQQTLLRVVKENAKSIQLLRMLCSDEPGDGVPVRDVKALFKTVERLWGHHFTIETDVMGFRTKPATKLTLGPLTNFRTL